MRDEILQKNCRSYECQKNVAASKKSINFDFILPGNFKNTEETNTAKHRNSKGWHNFQLHQDGFNNTATYHEAIKTIKKGHKVRLQAQTVHLY